MGSSANAFPQLIFVVRTSKLFHSIIYTLFYNNSETLDKISLKNNFGECLNFEIPYRVEKFI